LPCAAKPPPSPAAREGHAGRRRPDIDSAYRHRDGGWLLLLLLLLLLLMLLTMPAPGLRA
jgi:hypothetical protein